MNQHSWVYGCYAHYLENGYEPGNPEDGTWEAAHWPVPACLGGSKTILLLKEHHAVHGVLQSEEWGRPCVYGWELAFLSGELLALDRKWLAEKASRGGVASKARRAAMTEEERREYARRQAEHARRAPHPESQAVRIIWPDGRAEVVASQREAARAIGCERKTVRKALRRPTGEVMAPGSAPGGLVPSGVRVQRVDSGSP